MERDPLVPRHRHAIRRRDKLEQAATVFLAVLLHDAPECYDGGVRCRVPVFVARTAAQGGYGDVLLALDEMAQRGGGEERDRLLIQTRVEALLKSAELRLH